MKIKSTLLPLAMTIACAFASQSASAATITTINSSAGAGTTLTNALLGGGINVVTGSTVYQGTNTAALAQSGLYSGFNLAPSSGTGPALSMANGIVLTSGKANVPGSNTSVGFSNSTGSGSNAMLTSLAGTSTNDANTLGFQFTVAAGVTSISAKFVFGTDEYNEYSVTDIFGFFVDGVNYAKFANGALISNAAGAGTLIDNRSGAYGIEYDGLSNVLTVTGLLDASLLTHSFMVGIADTSDSVVDSGVFLSSLTAGTAAGGGITTEVPEPASLALFGLGLAAVAARRRKSAQSR